MNRSGRLVVSAYGITYFFAVWAATIAVDHGEAVAAAALFTASAGLLVGIHRECRHAARLIRIVGVYRHHQVPDPGDQYAAAVEYATACPPGCLCETWWSSLGDHHDPRCPAHIRKDLW